MPRWRRRGRCPTNAGMEREREEALKGRRSSPATVTIAIWTSAILYSVHYFTSYLCTLPYLYHNFYPAPSTSFASSSSSSVGRGACPRQSNKRGTDAWCNLQRRFSSVSRRHEQNCSVVGPARALIHVCGLQKECDPYLRSLFVGCGRMARPETLRFAFLEQVTA